MVKLLVRTSSMFALLLLQLQQWLQGQLAWPADLARIECFFMLIGCCGMKPLPLLPRMSCQRRSSSFALKCMACFDNTPKSFFTWATPCSSFSSCCVITPAVNATNSIADFSITAVISVAAKCCLGTSSKQTMCSQCLTNCLSCCHCSCCCLVFVLSFPISMHWFIIEFFSEALLAHVQNLLVHVPSR